MDYECEICGCVWEEELDCDWPKCPDCKEDIHIHLFGEF